MTPEEQANHYFSEMLMFRKSSHPTDIWLAGYKAAISDIAQHRDSEGVWDADALIEHLNERVTERRES